MGYSFGNRGSTMATVAMSRELSTTPALVLAVPFAPASCGGAGVSAAQIAAGGPGRVFPPVSDLPSRADFPDPLVLLDGRRVTSREQWFNERRPELVALFQHYMYGFLP